MCNIERFCDVPRRMFSNLHGNSDHLDKKLKLNVLEWFIFDQVFNMLDILHHLFVPQISAVVPLLRSSSD